MWREVGGQDTLVDLLSSASSFLWANGLPNDPAMWDDWQDAFAEVAATGHALNSEFCSEQTNSSGRRLTLLDAFSAMLIFLEEIFDRSGGDLPLREITERLMSSLSDFGRLNDSSVWFEWAGSVRKVGV
jgi:hypothetical protein